MMEGTHEYADRADGAVCQRWINSIVLPDKVAYAYRRWSVGPAILRAMN
jgi:hypothetical protein